MLTDLGNYISNKISNLVNVTDDAMEDLIKDICTNLISSNVNPKYILDLRILLRKDLIDNKNTNNKKFIQNCVFKRLVDFLDPKVEPYKIKKNCSNVVVFVGLQGAGKTTSICKYANYYKKKGFKTGIVCADTFRAGAFDQVKQNAEKINIPFYGSDLKDPIEVAVQGVAKFRKNDFELILVDTSGRHTQELQLFEEMKLLVNKINPNNIVFVMDAGIGQSAESQALGFKSAVSIGSIILTKLDGASKAGGALSSVAATRSPIEFIGTGEGMDDFELFNSKRFVSKLLGMGDIESLVEKISTIDIQEDMTKRLITGKFTLNDFRQFLNQIISMGPLSNILKMIPGMNNIDIPDDNKFHKMLYIFDSMCKSELNSNSDIFKNKNRIARIAKGSGSTQEEVIELIHSYKTMGMMAKKMMTIPGFSDMFNNNNSNNLNNTNLNNSIIDSLD